MGEKHKVERAVFNIQLWHCPPSNYTYPFEPASRTPINNLGGSQGGRQSIAIMIPPLLC